MHSTKLVLILKTLHSDEISRLEKFICSPYFADVKQRVKIQELFQLLQKEYPLFNRPDFDKAFLFKKLYPEEPFSASKLDKLMSRLLRLIKKFIITEQVYRNENQQQLILSRYYRDQQLIRPFQQNAQLLKRKQSKVEAKDKDFYLNHFLLEREIADFEGLFNVRKENLNLPDTLKSLDAFYLVTKLEYTCRLLSQQSSAIPLSIQDSLLNDDHFTLLIKDRPQIIEPLILAYYQAYLILSAEDGLQAYAALRKTLSTHARAIPFEQMKALQVICRNFCAQQYNQGDRSYLDELFLLYKEHLEDGYLYYNGGLRPSTIKNIMTLGLKLQQFDWVYDFLETHKNRIVGTTHEEDIYQFNLSLYYFALKEYNKTLDHLADKYEDTYYKIAARRLELKVYYEQKSVLLPSKMEAFKVYLFRISKKLLTSLHRRGNNNFIDMLKQIQNPKTLKNNSRIQKLIDRMDSKETMMEKEWLLEKLEELR